MIRAGVPFVRSFICKSFRVLSVFPYQNFTGGPLADSNDPFMKTICRQACRFAFKNTGYRLSEAKAQAAQTALHGRLGYDPGYLGCFSGFQIA